MRELTRKPKIFVLSLHRCGTTSATTFLEKAGYNCGHWINSFSELDLQRQVEGREEDLHHVFEVLEPAIEHYDALSDVPIPALYGELYDHYPDAKYILMTRGHSEWVKSVRKHTANRDLNPFEKVQYVPYLGKDVKALSGVDDTDLIWMSCKHVTDVVDFFRGRRAMDRLLVVDLRDDQCGEKLCRFLGLSEDLPMVHFKKRKKTKIEKFIKYKYRGLLRRLNQYGFS